MVNITNMFEHMCIRTNIILLYIMCTYDYTYTFIYPDKDECMDIPPPCPGTCTNTIGGYNCGCYAGYELDADGFSCNSKQKLLVLFW